jgi:DNA-binding NarL/FixJ family response regulator
MTGARVRVLVADDHPLVRDGLRALLAADPTTEFIGEAGDGAAAVELARRLRPDVVVMDLQLPGTDGIRATKALMEAVPGVAVLVLTMRSDDASLFAALRAGASGYLLKGSSGQDVLAAVHAVHHGEAVFGPGVAHRLLGVVRGEEPATAAPFPALTRREREVLDRVASGASNAEIARDLGLSQKTVRNHLSVIFTKLRVTDRARAIVRAREAGLGRDD